MSLPYLVKLEIVIAHVESLQKETPEFIPSQLWPPIRQIWIQLITACWYYFKRRCTKHASLDWTDWTATVAQAGSRCHCGYFVSGVFDSSRSVTCIMYTASCNISHMMLSTGFKSGEF